MSSGERFAGLADTGTSASAGAGAFAASPISSGDTISTRIGSGGLAGGSAPGHAIGAHNRTWAIADAVSAVRTKLLSPKFEMGERQFLVRDSADDTSSEHHHSPTRPIERRFPAGVTDLSP